MISMEVHVIDITFELLQHMASKLPPHKHELRAMFGRVTADLMRIRDGLMRVDVDDDVGICSICKMSKTVDGLSIEGKPACWPCSSLHIRQHAINEYQKKILSTGSN